MFRRNPTIKCPVCGTGNKSQNWQCWSCKSELADVGGASAPWADRSTVFGGKLHAGVGASVYRNNPAESLAINNLNLVSDYADKIYNKIPSGQGLKDWMEHFLAVVSSDLSDIVHNLRFSEPRDRNPNHKYMAKANARLIKSYAEELLELLHDVDSVKIEDWMRSKISACSNRIDSVWHSLEIRDGGALALPSRFRRNMVDMNSVLSSEMGLEVAENIFNRNPDLVESDIGEVTMDPVEEELEGIVDGFVAMRRNPYSRRRNSDAAWGDPLFRRNPRRSMRRRNSAPVWGGPLYRKNSDAAWGDPLFRKNPRHSMRRRNSAPVWGGPLYRKNSDAAWGDPLFRRNPRRSMRRRNAQAPVWGDTLFRRNPRSSMRRRNAQAPVWGGPLYRRRLQRNPQPPVWGGPLFRRNPCEDCDCDPCTCGTASRRRNPECLDCGGDPCTCGAPASRRWNPSCDCAACGCDPCTCGTASRRWNPGKATMRWAPCAGCGKASCNCGCGGDESLCICSGRGTSFRSNPNRRFRRNSAPAWGGPLYRRNG